MSDIVKFEVSDHIAVITMQRPPVNALNPDMRTAIIEAFDSVSENPDIRVAVFTSNQKAFCAGADLGSRPKDEKFGDYSFHNRLTRETTNCIRECAKPVIGAINGAALGAGMGIAAACDIMLASENAVFGMPEIDVGLAGGASMLNVFFPRSRVRRMMFTGLRSPAAELYRLGIIEACTKPEDLMPETMKLAAEIASKSPLGIKYAKASCNMVELMPQRDAYRFEQNFTVELSKTEDAKEAKKAFLEKRKPNFKGF